MRYRNVGKSGLKVSEIAVGSWMTDLSDANKQSIAEEVIRKAYDDGVNFFDCADAYSGGEAERFLGRRQAMRESCRTPPRWGDSDRCPSGGCTCPC